MNETALRTCKNSSKSRNRICRAGLVLALSSASSLMALVQAAHAEDLAAAEAYEDGIDPLGTITVTAQKTESSAQSTPIAISVFSQEELRRQDVHDLASLAHTAPDVNFRQGSDSPIVTIRGISSSDTTQLGDPTVAVATDGVYLNRPYALNNSMFDIERIEVLRGPQGTLSGRNAVGGAINIITAKPKKDDEGFVSLQLGNYGTVNTEAMFNFALSDSVQVRVAGQTRDNKGYRKIPPFGRADDQESRSLRAGIAFHPTDNLRGVVQFEYNHIGGAGVAQQYIALVRDDLGNVVHDKPEIPSYSTFPYRIQPSQDIDVYSLRGQLDYDLPFATLTYIGGYNKIDFNRTANNNIDYPSTFNMDEHPETLNQELHIASDPDDRFSWIAGVYYFREVNTSYNYVLKPGVTGAQVRGNTYDYDNTATSLAGFATVGFKVVPELKIDAGIRYTHDTKRQTGNTYYANVNVDPVQYFEAPGSGSASFNKPTFHVGLNWQPTPENMVYAKFDTGYKSGGFTIINKYGPETAHSWEVGSKNRFWDNRLQFNIAGFYQTYTGQHVASYVPVADTLELTIVNAGKSEIYGIEPEVVADAGPLGLVSLSAQWLHARLTDFVYKGEQYAGNSLPQAPDFSMSASLIKEFELDFGTIEFAARSKIQSRYYLNFYNYANQRQGTYSNTSLNLAFSPPSDTWRLEAYVRNLEDTHVIEDALENPYANAYRYSYAPPRTFGAKLSLWF